MKALLILACFFASCSSAPAEHKQKAVTAPSPFADALDACSAIEHELNLLDASRRD